MRVFLLLSHVTILSRVSNSSVRTANKALMALLTNVIASFCPQRSMRPGTFVTLKIPIIHLGKFHHRLPQPQLPP